MRLVDFFKSLFKRKEPPKKRSSRGWRQRLPRWLRGDYTMKNSELVFSATSRIANALSAMPVRLYKGSSPYANDLDDLISFAPTPNMTSPQWFKTMEACRCAYGNAYALKQYDTDGTLTRVDVLDPDRVKPIMDVDSGELWYRITPDEGQAFYVHNYYVIHLPFISTNGHTGINPVSVLLDTLTYNDQIQTFSAGQLEKGINAQIVIEAPANLGEVQRQQTIEDLQSTWKDSEGNLLLLESGLTAHTLNLSPVDTKIFEVEKITRSKVAMVYNLPPHLLGDYSDTSFASQEQQMLEFLTLTMTPIVTAYEAELNRKLLTKAERRKGYHFKFNMEAILRADAATRADVYQKAIRGGWMKPNEVRAEYNLSMDKSGNKLLVSRDLTTLDNLLSNPNLATAPAAAAPVKEKAAEADEAKGGEDDE